jgi:uncharacterized membrane protein (DUF485 family)
MREYLFQAPEGLALMITNLDVPAAVAQVRPNVSPTSAFDDCMAAKNRMLLVLGTAIFIYYFALIVGAGWFRALYTQVLPGGLNVGIAFALSQYVFVAVLALIYAQRMRHIDAQIKTLVEVGELKHETH